MNETAARSKSYFFPVFFFLFVAAHMVAVVCGWDYLRAYLTDYEAGRPEKPLKALVSQLEAGDFSQLARLCGYELSPYEQPDAFERYLREKRFGGGGEITYAVGETDAAGTHCDLLRGGAAAASVTLRRRDFEGTHGFGVYELVSAAAPVETAPPCRVRAPQGARVFYNGVEASNPEREKIPVEAYASEALGEKPPENKIYCAEGLLFWPEVSVEGPDGRPCELVDGTDGADYTAVTRPRAEEQPAFESLALEAARAYALFTTGDAPRSGIAGRLIPGTESWKRLAAFDNSWFISHDAASVTDAAADQFIVYDDRRFSCEVRLICRVRMGKKIFDYPSFYSLYFALRQDGWKIAELRVR